MAELHSRIPVQNMQRGERMVYEVMAQLPADWVIFHSCKEDYLEDNHHVHYEADFVVLVPGRGLAVIEVKDWPQVRIENGQWQSRAHNQAPWKTHTHSPLEQANIAMQKIMRSLSRCGCLPHHPSKWPEHRHAAILTQTNQPETCPGNLPLGTLYLCGAENLSRLQQHIESLFTLNQAERMSPQRMQKITEALVPSIRFKLSISNYLQEMDAAAAHLLELLPMLSKSTGGIRIEGCAGSGKTVMACAEAARQAAAAPRDGETHILMLCFNHALAHELQHNPLLAEHSDVLLISTFHDFCIQHILAPRGLDHLINYSAQGDRLTDEAIQHITVLIPELPHYDAIFVDEAQDFRHSWWQIIQALLRPDGKFYLFADKHQDLYDRYEQMPDIPTRLNLHSNLRNARQIADYSRAMLPTAEQNMDILPMCGDGIHLSAPADTPQERAAEIQRLIQHLLQSDSHIRPCDIVVLSPWRTTHPRCSLPLVRELATAHPDETPAQAAERRATCRRPDASSIFASTIKSFKGQESAYIIVSDIIGLGESRGFDIKEFYTACTRARYGLYLIPTSSGKELIESFSS